MRPAAGFTADKIRRGGRFAWIFTKEFYSFARSVIGHDIDLDKLSPQQIELLTLFEKLPESKRGAVLEIIRSLIG